MTETREKGCVHCTAMHLGRCPDAFSPIAKYCGNYDHRPVTPVEPAPAPEGAPKKYIEWELENDPSVFDKPRSGEFIDRLTLTHVIRNVNRPEGVDFKTFQKVLSAIAEELECFPYFKAEDFKGETP